MKIGQRGTFTFTHGTFRLTEHKYFQYQIETNNFNENPFELSASWTTRKDHAGFEFIFSIFKMFWICFSILDNRHWDFENECWKESDDCSFDENSWHRPDEPEYYEEESREDDCDDC